MIYSILLERYRGNNMKKGLLVAAVAALTFALAAPVAVYADGSSTTSDVSITITDAAIDGIKVGDSASVVNAAWGTSFDTSLVVVFTGDAHLTPTGATAPTPAITETFAASLWNGTVIAHKGKTVQSGASITLSSDDLSPVVVLGPASKVPNTGDSSNNILWISALVIALVCGGAAFAMRKSNA